MDKKVLGLGIGLVLALGGAGFEFLQVGRLKSENADLKQSLEAAQKDAQDKAAALSQLQGQAAQAQQVMGLCMGALKGMAERSFGTAEAFKQVQSQPAKAKCLKALGKDFLDLIATPVQLPPQIMSMLQGG